MIENFTLCITTYNRIDELKFTLAHLDQINILSRLRCLICDDGSKDETSEFLMKNYPDIDLIRHQQNKGLIQSRNELFNSVKTEYAIFLDDDAHFLIPPDFEKVDDYFEINRRCAVLSLRVYWGVTPPRNIKTNEKAVRTTSYLGGANVFRTAAWNEIPDYPEWYKFYGEEDFASFHLFKRNWEIHYYPDILVQHRVDVHSRKNNKDYVARTRRALRAGWSNYLMFYPIKLIPRKLAASIWRQFKGKILRGEYIIILSLISALFDILSKSKKLFMNSNRLTQAEYDKYINLKQLPIYWRA